MTTPSERERLGDLLAKFVGSIIAWVGVAIGLWWSWPRVVGAKLWLHADLTGWEAWSIAVFAWAIRTMLRGLPPPSHGEEGKP